MARSFVLLFFCLLMITVSHAEPDEQQRALIQELFPKATRIEKKLSDYPVYPVYQLSQLLGYAYESKYITNLTGYSGKPIDLMIGIDVEGHFSGVHVVNHHEPVFLHGLGEAPLFEFVVYAVGLLVVGMFVHKFFCRYLCPLGAGLAVLGRFRLFSWLERIKLCGSPCQLCKKRCEINAIRTDGRIDYNECIQCLECVVILRDGSQCVDSLVRQKQQRRGEILAVEVV